jgi:hypothetical protein
VRRPLGGATVLRMPNDVPRTVSSGLWAWSERLRRHPRRQGHRQEDDGKVSELEAESPPPISGAVSDVSRSPQPTTLSLPEKKREGGWLGLPCKFRKKQRRREQRVLVD